MIDESTTRRTRFKAVKGYVQAAFPKHEVHSKAYENDNPWIIKVARASHQVVHEVWIMRHFLDDHPDPVATLRLWGLAAKMKMNGANPVTVSTTGLST